MNNRSSTSFEETALPHLDSVYRAAFALSGKAKDAEDLTQDTFLKALEAFSSFRPGTNCRAWLLRIVRNVWIDGLRRKKPQYMPIEEEIIEDRQHNDEVVWSNAEDLIENFSDEQVIRTLSELPDDQRLTLFLVDVEQLSQMEVAEITGVPAGTVKSRTSRARAAVKQRLTGYAEDMGFAGGQR